MRMSMAVAMVYALALGACGSSAKEPARPAAEASPAPPGAMSGDGERTSTATERDPVCGMWVDPRTAQHKSEHEGKTFYFCSAEDKAKFDKDPGSFASQAP